MKQEKLLAPWQKYSGHVNMDAFIETLYNSLIDTESNLIKHS